MRSPPDTETTTTALNVLAEPRRRYVLATLLDREDTSSTDPPSTTPMAIETLATEVVATARDCPIVSDEQCKRTHVALVHAHVPRLVDDDVLTRRTDGDTTTVALADHPMLAADWVRTLLADPTGETFAGDEATLNRTLEAIRKPRRRVVCTALASRRGAVDVSDLAAMVARREADAEMRLIDVTESACTSVAATLVHEHLPALDAVGLVNYDGASKRAELATDAPQWRADWIVQGPLADAADHVWNSSGRPTVSPRTGALTADSAPYADRERGDAGLDTCRTIEGCETVIATGHDIADSADEELFLTIPDADMIQQKCLERWRDAADRGVDVYVGSHSPRVRDTVRSAIPGATVCEPQLDWLNFPIERGNHGRIVFADRERAMIVTIDELDSDPEPRVGAITGEGRGNALVSLLCEHMGPRLDQLTTETDCDTQDETPMPI